MSRKPKSVLEDKIQLMMERNNNCSEALKKILKSIEHEPKSSKKKNKK